MPQFPLQVTKLLNILDIMITRIEPLQAKNENFSQLLVFGKRLRGCIADRFEPELNDGLALPNLAAAMTLEFGGLSWLTEKERKKTWLRLKAELKSFLPEVIEAKNKPDKWGNNMQWTDENLANFQLDVWEKTRRADFANEAATPAREEKSSSATELDESPPNALLYWYRPESHDDPPPKFLKEMALALLSMPISSAPSESLFSTAGFQDAKRKGKAKAERLAQQVKISRNFKIFNSNRAFVEATCEKIYENKNKKEN
jgi:hypothetical protein